MKTIAKDKLYWICQFGGWMVFISMELIGYMMIDGFKGTLLLNAVLNFFLGIGITHLYRLFLIKTGWLQLPLYKLIPRGILAVIVMAIILTAINIPLDRYTYPIFQQIQINAAFLMMYFFNLSKFVLLWALTYHLFQYWERSLMAEKEKYQLQAVARENAYTNLKNQLNPHFLFNSLNSIRTLVDVDPELSKTAINQLSGLLRSSLHTGKQRTITLRQELQTVTDYLAIERIRFDSRLNWEYQIDENTFDYQVPPMMLQTLVENAVKHGISNLKQGGLIRLKGNVFNNMLTLQLFNSGQYNPQPGHQGVGLANTAERLAILYDERASISIKNLNTEFVLTEIILPV